MAEKQRCQRCGAEEYIPTFQYVKFDNQVQYVCSACWQNFRKWFFMGSRLDKRDYDSAA
jgi:DNA-directed RNA polymerase subunit RPC12/RpoP